jgi:hypothetical protein
MISKLRKHALSASPVDIVKYLNFTTFDITGDLAFDDSLGSLESEDLNQWVANTFAMLRVGAIMRVLTGYGLPMNKIIDSIPAMAKARDSHDDYTKLKTARRLDKKTDRKDFIR